MSIEAMLPLIADLPAHSARRAIRALLAKEGEEHRAAHEESLADFAERARAAFEKDMRPVVEALETALRANDLAALKGLRAMLEPLLREVNRAPALADLLALQLGTAFLEGFTAKDAEGAKGEEG
jgi:hypothetical protein